jgi:hypothetical protein
MSVQAAERLATNGATTMYARLEERVLERDQLGASDVFYDLVRSGRPLTEILRETVRIHAPYTHVPYHQRIDNGFVRFVNNDHCLLSARASLRLQEFVPDHLRFLPMAQTIWYVPTGLDPWNQLLGYAPGHYGRRTYKPERHPTVPRPSVHWEDQEPLHLDGPFEERLNHWLTLVQYGHVIESYRVFLGLFEERQQRRRLLSHLVFAGLIDVQDRMLYNRSYTTGHKGYRARATVELGDAIGWDQAHHILYAGVPDMAVGPRWHSLYEMACQIAWTQLARDEEKPESSLDPSPALAPERHLLDNVQPLTPDETREFIHAITQEPEPAYIDAITSLLLAGKDPRHILDTIQIASAGVVLEVGQPANFSMPHHGYEYTNTVRWFYDTFDHPLRLRLLYVAGAFINQCARWVRATPGNGAADTRVPREAGSLAADDLLQRLDAAMLALKPPESVAWTRAYLEGGYDRKPLVRTLALGALKQGNDPHNQEIGLCLLEDYLHSTAHDREQLLLASAQFIAGHVKYGDPQQAYRRFTEAFGL